MKRLLTVIGFLVVLCASSSAFAQGWSYGMPIRQAGNFGIGIGAGTLGWPISMKYYLESAFAIQGNVGWWRNRWGCDGRGCYGGSDALAVSADGIFEMPVLVGNGDIDLAWNFGFGGGVGIRDNDNDPLGFAVAGVLGLAVLINAIPIDIVLEYRPGFLIIPDFDLDLVNFTGHLRFYF